jgi:hypothetical protein
VPPCWRLLSSATFRYVAMQGGVEQPPVTGELTLEVVVHRLIYGCISEKQRSVSQSHSGDGRALKAAWIIRTPLARGQFSYEASFHHAHGRREEDTEIDLPRDHPIKIGTWAQPLIRERKNRRVYRPIRFPTGVDEVENVREGARRLNSRRSVSPLVRTASVPPRYRSLEVRRVYLAVVLVANARCTSRARISHGRVLLGGGRSDDVRSMGAHCNPSPEWKGTGCRRE